MSLQPAPARGAVVDAKGAITPEWLAWLKEVGDAVNELQIATTTAGGTAVPGSGDVVGPVGAVPNHIAVFDEATGKRLKDGEKSIATVIAEAVASASATILPIDLTSEVTGDLSRSNFAPMSAASRVLGRGDSGAGDVEELTAGAGLRVTGTALEAEGGEPWFDAGSSWAAKTLDWSDGIAQQLTLDANCTLTLTNPRDGVRVVLALLQDATGTRVPTFPAAVKWPGGVVPTWSAVAGHVDLVVLVWNALLGASGNYLAVAYTNYTPA